MQTTFDTLTVASHYVTLERKPRHNEYCGPCPACGGEDRFVVTANNRWLCRVGKFGKGRAFEG